MKKIFILIIVSFLFFVSCKKETVNNNSTDNVKNMNELSVDPDFNWKTTTDYHIKLKSEKSGLIKIENDNGVVFQSAFIKANEEYTMKLTIPTYQKAVHLMFNSEDVLLKLESTEIQYYFN